MKDTDPGVLELEKKPETDLLVRENVENGRGIYE